MLKTDTGGLAMTHYLVLLHYPQSLCRTPQFCSTQLENHCSEKQQIAEVILGNLPYTIPLNTEEPLIQHFGHLNASFKAKANNCKAYLGGIIIKA